MSRWVRFLICALLGLVLLVCGWLVPAHLRAVDWGILRLAARNTPSLVDHGLRLIEAKNLGAAEMILRAAELTQVPDRQKLAVEIVRITRENPRLAILGGPDLRLGQLGLATLQPPQPEPFTSLVMRLENRNRIFESLKTSPRNGTQEVLRTRRLTETVLIPASGSAAGQAFDAAVVVSGLLLDGGHLSPGVSDSFMQLAEEANRGGNSQRLEQALLDFLSLGQRMNWSQLVSFVKPIEDLETLRLITNVVRRDEAQLPVLFSAMRLSEKPEAVTRYALDFSKTGLKDLGMALRLGSGAVKELLARHQRLYLPALRTEVIKYDPFGAFYYFALGYSWLMPSFSLFTRWLLFLAAGGLLAAAVHYLRRVPVLEEPLQVRGFHFAREFLFGLGFLVVVLLLSEPFLAQDNQKADFPFRLRVPLVGIASTAAAANTPATSKFMNPETLQVSLLTLSFFFVLQALIYTACLLKLAEIRRQNVPARTKLKLLDNEDHLFDSGLYLGFVGTIISLILVSLGVTKFSVMAAYSSTSFGIIFCSVFKVFNLRPVRRKLVMESEANLAEAAPRASAPTLIAHS